ncbi:MAG: hypothetical protein L3K16_02450 [Thermoplasmata archaeon]|nr:hypothetical protein [Thermoplasmata archaeon]
MPTRQRGDKVYVDLRWQGPRIFSQHHSPETIASYSGVYLITSRRGFYRYPRGHSSLAYIGRSRDVGTHLDQHVGEGRQVAEQLRDEGTLRFWWAQVGYGNNDGVEQILYDDFEARHGARPLLNQVRSSCSRKYGEFVVRHGTLAIPHHFPTAAQFDS